VLSYVDKLVLAGYKEQSIHTILGGVRAMFHANNLPWPLQRRDLHLGLPQEDEGGIVMGVQDIAGLIKTMKPVAGSAVVAVALSTVYGLRAAEIAAVISAGCDGKKLVVQTVKTGRKREHRIPPVLSKRLRFGGRKIGVDGVHKMFTRLMTGYVRLPREREGWHSIRRALITGLLESGVPDVVVHRWMGWRTAPNQHAKIAFRYFKPDGGVLDDQVYAQHPFLPMWG